MAVAEVAEEPEPEEGEPEAEAATPFSERDALLDPIDKELGAPPEARAGRRAERGARPAPPGQAGGCRRPAPRGRRARRPLDRGGDDCPGGRGRGGRGVVRRERRFRSRTWPTSWPARSPRRCAIASTAASPPPTATSTTSPTGSEPCTGSGRARGSPTRPATTRPPPTPAGCSTPRPAAPRSTGWSIRSGAGAPTATTTCSAATSRRAPSSPPATPVHRRTLAAVAWCSRPTADPAPIASPRCVPLTTCRAVPGALANPGRGRTWLVVGAVLLFFLITSLRGIASFYTDFLWYDSLGRSEIWRGVLGAEDRPVGDLHRGLLRDHVDEPRDRRPAGATVPAGRARGRGDRALPRAGARPRRTRAAHRCRACSP